MARKKANVQQTSLFGDNEVTFVQEATPPRAVTLPEQFPEGWSQHLAKEFGEPYFEELQNFIREERASHDIFPEAADVFNAYRFTPLEQVRVVLLGQDPYPTPGHAHGLCFSVRPGVNIPASLRNIYQEMQSDLGFAPVKHGNLESWAKQGVFMLNAVLTVRSGAPNSHAKRGWENFTDATLQAINKRPQRVVFVLWGAYAQKKAKLIDTSKHKIIASAHPSPLSACAGFFGSKPFSKVNAALAEASLDPINWQLPEKLG
jgi:uracil-DNA glycosylase